MFISSFTVVWALEDNKSKAVEAYLTSAQIENKHNASINKYIVSFKKIYKNNTKDQNKTKEISEEDKVTAAKIEKTLRNHLSWKNSKAQYVTHFTSTYSTEELEKITDFFNTKVGKKYTSADIKSYGDSTNIFEENMENALPEINKIMEEVLYKLFEDNEGSDKAKSLKDY
jgi:ABC-type transporter MlaC component